MHSFREIWNFHWKVGRKKDECISSQQFFPTPKKLLMIINIKPWTVGIQHFWIAIYVSHFTWIIIRAALIGWAGRGGCSDVIDTSVDLHEGVYDLRGSVGQVVLIDHYPGDLKKKQTWKKEWEWEFTYHNTTVIFWNLVGFVKRLLRFWDFMIVMNFFVILVFRTEWNRTNQGSPPIKCIKI